MGYCRGFLTGSLFDGVGDHGSYFYLLFRFPLEACFFTGYTGGCVWCFRLLLLEVSFVVPAVVE